VLPRRRVPAACAGLSERAVQRKATCRALFSKMLYLIESEAVLKPTDDLNTRIVRNVRACTRARELLLKSVFVFSLPTGTSSVPNQRGLAGWPVTSSSTLTRWPLGPGLATNQRGARAIGARASGVGL
jgi:hypothetical protein